MTFSMQPRSLDHATVLITTLTISSDVSIWSAVEASLGIVAASAYTLRPLFRSLLNLTSRATNGYGTSKGAGASHNGYTSRKKPGNSRKGRSSQAGVMRIPEPAHLSPGMAGSRSPFGDSNEDFRGPSEDSDHGGIQVHKTFEIQTAKDEEAHEMQWRTPKSSESSVSIV